MMRNEKRSPRWDSNVFYNELFFMFSLLVKQRSMMSSESNESPLESYCMNLNKRARLGKIDPLIGRNEEIQRTVQVLCRRRKNNPLLVGEAGVGKTAIAEGLAKLIVEGKVPAI